MYFYYWFDHCLVCSQIVTHENWIIFVHDQTHSHFVKAANNPNSVKHTCGEREISKLPTPYLHITLKFIYHIIFGDKLWPKRSQSQLQSAYRRNGNVLIEKMDASWIFLISALFFLILCFYLNLVEVTIHHSTCMSGLLVVY